MLDVLFKIAAGVAVLAVTFFIAGFVRGSVRAIRRRGAPVAMATGDRRAAEAARHAAAASRLWLLAFAANVAFFLLLAFAVYVMVERRNPAASILLVAGGAGWWFSGRIRLVRIRHLERAIGFKSSSAEGELAVLRNANRPFALFLRGFDWDKALVKRHGFLIDMGTYQASGGTRQVEMLAAQLLGDSLPLLALADPRDPGPIPGAFRFDNVPTDWEPFVKRLIDEARLIVVYISSMTKGLERELEMLAAGALDKTIVVVGAVSRRQRRKLMPVLSTALQRFPRIVEESHRQGFADQLRHHFAAVTDMEVSDRRARMSQGVESTMRRVLGYLPAPITAATIIFGATSIRNGAVEWWEWPAWSVALVGLQALLSLLFLTNRAALRLTDRLFGQG